MKTLQINIPNGYEIDNFNKETGEISFKSISPTKLEDLLRSLFTNNISINHPNHPSVIFHKSLSNQFVYAYNTETRLLWYSDENVGDVLEKEIKLNYDELRDAIKDFVIKNSIHSCTLECFPIKNEDIRINL